MKTTEHKYIHDITKEYKDMFKVINYRSPLHIISGVDKVSVSNLKRKLKEDEDSIQRSVRRTKSVIRDYTLNNDFQLFVTFTFNPKKVDRYSFSHCAAKMQSWLSRVRLASQQADDPFKYIVVPEFHKDGAIHFHALISGYPKPIKPTNVIMNSKRVYNLPSFRYGFTNAQKIDDGKDIYGYLTKYVTKDMPLVSNRKRYWSSRNLEKPIIYHNALSDLNLVDKMIIKNQTFENQYSVIYQIPKFD